MVSKYTSPSTLAMTSNKIYHGCGLAFEVGTVPLIESSFGFYKRTAYPFWKKPEDFESSVKTRSQLGNTPTVCRTYEIDYFESNRNNEIKTENVSYP